MFSLVINKYNFIRIAQHQLLKRYKVSIKSKASYVCS